MAARRSDWRDAVKTTSEVDPLEGIISARDLWDKEFPEPIWAVPGVIPEGVMILGGKPKMGKSWLAYSLAIAVASGGVALGSYPVEQGAALYLALEDGERRLRTRLKKLIPEGEPPDDLDLVTQWLRLDHGGTEALERWAESRENPRLVVIDTLKKVRPYDKGGRNIYDVDYEALESLLPVARSYGVAVVVVHHLRQMDADDPLDTLSGSTGLTGGVDGAMVLKRERGRADAFLYVTHRDIEDDLELAMAWDQLGATWASKGDAEEYRLSQERAAVIKVLRDVPEGMGPKDICDALAADGHRTTPGALRRLLPKMVGDSQLKNPRYGLYTVGNSGNAGNSTVTYGENSNITPGNTGNTYGNSYPPTGNSYRGGNAENPIKTPSVTADTAVTDDTHEQNGHVVSPQNLELATRITKAQQLCGDGRTKLSKLARQCARDAEPDAEPLAGALAAHFGEDGPDAWQSWVDPARRVIGELRALDELDEAINGHVD